MNISVIIPVHNAGLYLEECLASVFGQEFKKYEVICVDDASNDDISKRILEKYKKTYANMHIITLEQSIGAAGARNLGLSMAIGDYVIFLDADDVFSNQMLGTMYHKIEVEKADVCVCGYKKFYMEDEEKKYLFQHVPNLNRLSDRNNEDWFLYCCLSPWDKLCKRSFLQHHNICFQNLTSCNDVLFSCMVLKKASKIVYLEEFSFVEYRANVCTQISANRNPSNIIYAMDEFEKKLSETNSYDEIAYNQRVNLLVQKGLHELQICKNDDKIKECYELLQERIIKIQVFPKNKKTRFLCQGILNNSYEGRWFDKLDYYGQLKAMSKEIIKMLLNYDACFLWGLGKRGEAFQQICYELGISLSGVTDRKNENIGYETKYGYKVKDTQYVLDNAKIIIASNSKIYMDLQEQVSTTTTVIDIEQFCPF